MMISRNILTVLILNVSLLCQSCSNFNTSDSFNEERKSYDSLRVSRDALFIERIGEAHFENRHGLYDLLAIENRPKESLGFDYFLVKGSVGKEYIPIYYQLVYKKDSVVSYRLKSIIPDNVVGDRIYRKIFKDSGFLINGQIVRLEFNFDVASAPLDSLKLAFAKPLDNNMFRYLMTPYCGTEYGIKGRYGGEFLENRKLLIEIESQLSLENYAYMMSSYNPATRMLGLEYFIENGLMDEKNQALVELKEEILRACPKTFTYNGSVRSKFESTVLLDNIIHEKKLLEN